MRHIPARESFELGRNPAAADVSGRCESIHRTAQSVSNFLKFSNQFFSEFIGWISSSFAYPKIEKHWSERKEFRVREQAPERVSLFILFIFFKKRKNLNNPWRHCPSPAHRPIRTAGAVSKLRTPGPQRISRLTDVPLDICLCALCHCCAQVPSGGGPWPEVKAAHTRSTWFIASAESCRCLAVSECVFLCERFNLQRNSSQVSLTLGPTLITDSAVWVSVS